MKLEKAAVLPEKPFILCAPALVAPDKNATAAGIGEIRPKLDAEVVRAKRPKRTVSAE